MADPPRYGDPGQPGHGGPRWCPFLEVNCDRGCSRSEPCPRKVEAAERANPSVRCPRANLSPCFREDCVRDQECRVVKDEEVEDQAKRETAEIEREFQDPGPEPDGSPDEFDGVTDRPMNKKGDLAYSTEAAERVRPKATKLQKAIIEAFRELGDGMTARDVETLDRFGHYGYSTVRKRVSELHLAGILAFVDEEKGGEYRLVEERVLDPIVNEVTRCPTCGHAS